MGKLSAHVQQFVEGFESSGIRRFVQQERLLGQGFVGDTLAVDQPGGRERRRPRIIASHQTEPQTVLKRLAILDLEKLELLFEDRPGRTRFVSSHPSAVKILIPDSWLFRWSVWAVIRLCNPLSVEG